MPNHDFELLNKHLPVSYETAEKLKIYYDLLLKWQSKINLISNDTIGDIFNRHFLDSLQIIKLLPKISGTIVDIGSGAGFPGMVLAISGIRNIHLVESDSKKISFLKEVARLTKTEVLIHHSRIEELPETKASAVVARALAPLEELFSYAFPLVSHGAICLFPKGKKYSMEIEEAKKIWNFDYNAFPSITDPEGMILEIRNLERAGA